ncbi:hypothetical protein [Nakamurella lactea]|uniref:hypothetical protein n=1 Tax=Nakamurella lactea TaxID=459515 RepID=UPI001B7F93DD|nr:hypothetical protein [Nakamurella lactea]
MLVTLTFFCRFAAAADSVVVWFELRNGRASLVEIRTCGDPDAALTSRYGVPPTSCP